MSSQYANAAAQPTSAAAPDSPRQAPGGLAAALLAAGSAAYQWDITSDDIVWSDGADHVLGRDLGSLTTGRAFAGLLDSDNLTTRYDTIISASSRDNGEGVPYSIEYALKSETEGDPAVWIEDNGRWFADGEGKPAVACGLLRVITARHNRDQALSTLSHSDPLTGMMNRNRIDEALDQMIAENEVRKGSCAFVVAAIRNIDIVNEAYGFDVADEVITAIAQRLHGVMRQGDGIGRYAGSKFGILLNNCGASDLPVALERFLQVARDSVIETSRGPVWAMLSAGAVLVPSQADNGLQAKALAEEALSQSLRQSWDGYVIQSQNEDLRERRLRNVRCATEIVECLRDDRFELAFQPLVSTATGEVECHEALLRMRDSDGELVTAGHLVPVAEQLGLIRLVDRTVTRLAIATLHRYPEARLSINISATTANDPRWNSQIITMIEEARDVVTRLTLEITETTALADLSAALAFLEKLRAVGCCVAIDDFGAGFTSFRNLRDLPIDVIKLDGSYCSNLAHDPENAYFARTLIEMAHHFGIRTVAEWVETEEDANILRTLGIDFLQGHFLGRPSIDPPWQVAQPSAFEFMAEAEASVPATPATVFFEAVATTAEHGLQPFIADAVAEGDEPAFALASEPAIAPEPDTVSETFALLDAVAPTVEEIPSELLETQTWHIAEPGGVPSGETGSYAFDELEESLSRLRQTLELLSTGGEAAAPEQERRAS